MRTPDAEREVAERQFEAHYRQIYPIVLQVARKRAGRQAGEDAVQAVFARLWIQIKETPPGPLPADPELALRFLKCAVANELVTRHRAATVVAEYTDRVAAELYSAVPQGMEVTKRQEDGELLEQLEKARNAMPPRCRACYELAQDRGLSHEEIARELGVSTATVSNHMTKANRILRQELRQYFPDVSSVKPIEKDGTADSTRRAA